MAPRPVSRDAELAHRVEDLEIRVRKLEEQLATGPAPIAPQVHAELMPELASELHLQDAERLVPLLGKALLGLAGAYLLRALTTSSLAPAWAGVALALAYAVFWMLLASRLESSNALAGTVYMATSVLALCPMLWETTVRFHILNTSTTAMILTGFAVLGLALSWQTKVPVIGSLATASAAVMALALCGGTFDLVPFCAALIAMSAALEFAASRDLWPGLRRLVAVVADLAVLWLVYVTSRGPNLPSGYQPVPEILAWGVPAGLLVVYMAGTAIRTLGRALDMSIFEMVQLTMAFTLFVIPATRGSGAHLWSGAVLTFCGVFCYVVAFVRLIKAPHARNLYIYSIFGLSLTLLGTGLILPSTGMAIAWALISAGLGFARQRVGGLSLSLHSLAFLAAAGLVSGLAKDTFATMLQNGTEVGLTPATLVVFATMVGAYILLKGGPQALAATMLIWVGVAWAASLLLSGLPNAADAAWHAAVRTIFIVVAAVGVALIGRRWQRPELYWLVPGGMVIALYRLVAEDLRLGRPETLFLSLLCYGGALLLLSKLMRGWQHA